MNSISMHMTDVVGSRFTAPVRSPGDEHTGGTMGTAKEDTVSVVSPLPSNTPAKAAISHEELGRAVDKINLRAQQVMREIRFSMDDQSNRVVIKVIDQTTQEVIRVIPPEDVINIAEQFDKARGVLLEEKA